MFLIDWSDEDSIPPLEEEAPEDLDESIEILSGEEDGIDASEMQEFVHEDDLVIMMEGYREEEEENIPWDYINWDMIEIGEELELGITAYDRVLWADGLDVDEWRVEVRAGRMIREREEERRRQREEERRRQREEEERIYEGADNSLVAWCGDGVRVMANQRRVVRYDRNRVLGSFRNAQEEEIMLERMGEIRRREINRNRRGERRNRRGGEMGLGVDEVYSPAPIVVEGIAGRPSLLYSVDDLELGGINIDCVVGEDVEEGFLDGGSTAEGEDSN